MEFNQQIFNTLQDPIFIFTQDLKVVEYNLAFSRFFNTNDLIFPISFIEINRNLYFYNFLKNAIACKQSTNLSDFTFDTLTSPNTKYFEVKALPLEDSNFFLCILHDVTERKNTEQIKEDFISNFSHEIKTPLTVLHGHIQVLKTEIEDNPIIHKMEYNSVRMINLLNDLLLLSSVEKKSEIQKEIIQVEDHIRFLAQDLLVNYPDKKITLDFKIQTKEFYIDLPLFEQVLINLIDNSLKYGANRILIQTDSDNEHDILSIEDNGIGIPEHQIHRIFERFYRGEISHNSASKGTGLGLAIVKHIIQKHDAKISVTSQVNKGTKFALSFNKYSDT